jgi:prevent-host-death family protein
LEVLLAVLLEGAFMAKVPKIVPISDLRQDAAAVLKRVRSSREPVVITQRGRASAVMLSLDAYEESAEERRILRALARGDREIQAGKGASLDAVLREGGKLLEQD